MFVFCIESSHARGLGHLYRALTLATFMRERGMEVRFLINDHSSSIETLRRHNFVVEVVTIDDETCWESRWLSAHSDIRVWVNDRLDTGAGHASRIRAAGIRLATFDDRGSGATFADLHIAALAFDDADKLKGARVFHGVDYLLLDPGLVVLRRVRNATGPVLLSMGGSDTWGVTPRVMQALLERFRTTTVVLGPAFSHWTAVDAILAQSPAGLFTVHRHGVPSLFAEMAKHELAITGGGMTPFQANACGLPCIVFASETFEIPVGLALERMGGSVFGGYHTEMNLSLIDRELPIASMSRAGMAAINLSGCDRVADLLLSLVD